MIAISETSAGREHRYWQLSLECCCEEVQGPGHNWLSQCVTYWNHNAMNIPFKCLGDVITEDEMKRKKEHTPEKWARAEFIYQSPAYRCFKNSRGAPSLRGPFWGFKPVRVPIPKSFPMRTFYSCRCSRSVAGSCTVAPRTPGEGVRSELWSTRKYKSSYCDIFRAGNRLVWAIILLFYYRILDFFVQLCQRWAI
jgi:hypothetical protein